MTLVKAAWTSFDMFKASLKKNKPEETKCSMLANDYNGYLQKELTTHFMTPVVECISSLSMACGVLSGMW